jgi:hypothetical protein
MSTFCSLEEAFALSSAAPAAPAASQPGKPSRKHRPKSTAVPATAPSAPDPDRQAQIQPVKEDVLSGSPAHGGAPKTTAANVIVSDGVRLDDMFPLPGDTGDGDEWEQAFILPGSRMPMGGTGTGAVPVDGKSTLWRQIPVPAVAPPAPLPAGGAGELASLAPAEVSARLDALTRQLESLTTPAPLQSTAELFLFVAIGLLILLAIDTLLRFAVRMASGVARMSGGGRLGRGRFRFGGGYRSRWY